MAINIQVADNKTFNVASILNSSLTRADDVRVAVAFVSRSGLRLIEPAMSESLEHGAYLEFLVGLDMRLTEPEAMRCLFDMSQKNDLFRVYCFVSADVTAVYHPKLYLLKSEEAVTCVVGSSNMTRGGLLSNVEVNVILSASADDEVISDLYSTYNRLKFHPNRVVPDEELLGLYSLLCEREKKFLKNTRGNEASSRLLNQFNEKAKSLQRPKATTRDLVGWAQLIYSMLPEGEFTNQQVYEYEALCQARYPYNRNIRAKIRQQLQVLRDMGLLEHTGKASWKKTLLSV